MQRGVLIILALLCLALHIALGHNYQPQKIAGPITPAAPSVAQLRLLALGDDALAYRLGGLAVQNFGEQKSGNATPLRDYDYAKLIDWFTLLAQLQPQADYHKHLAAYLYSATDNAQQLRLIINYLQQQAHVAGQNNWRWLAQASLLARHKLQDADLALAIAQDLAWLNEPQQPFWTKLTPAILWLQQNDYQAATLYLEKLQAQPTLTPENHAELALFAKDNSLTIGKDAP